MPDGPSITRALTSILQHSENPMVLTDPRGVDHPMIAVNDAFEALTGYPAEAAIGRNCRFLQGEHTDPETPRRIGRYLSKHAGCIEWILNYRRDGSKFWNLLFLSPVFDDAGQLLHYLGNQRDITHGSPLDLPDYVLGKAGMSLKGEAQFQALLQELIASPASCEHNPPGSARRLEQIIEQVRRLNDVTLDLVNIPWTPP